MPYSVNIELDRPTIRRPITETVRFNISKFSRFISLARRDRNYSPERRGTAVNERDGPIVAFSISLAQTRNPELIPKLPSQLLVLTSQSILPAARALLSMASGMVKSSGPLPCFALEYVNSETSVLVWA